MANKPLRQVLAENVKALRAYRKLSQSDMKARTKLDPGTVSRIELQKMSVSLETLGALARGLRVEPWQLVHPDGAALVAQQPVSPEEHEKVERLLEEIGELSKSAQAELFGKSETVREIMKADSPSNTRLEQKGWSAATKSSSRLRSR